MKIELGDKVKDTITGFKGVVVCIATYLNGCRRLAIQPPLSKDGDFKEATYFDEPQIMLISKATIAKGNSKTGGPDKYVDKRRL